jgi:CRISPR-associated endonuclease/helicase Cas3
LGVARLSALFLTEKPEKVRDELSDLCRVIALTHDIGKATSYFQKYLFAVESERQRIKGPETNHSLFSAICVYYLAKGITDNCLHPLFAYITVRRHHGNLIDVSDEVSIFDQGDAVLLHRQLESIDDAAFTVLTNQLSSAGLPLIKDKVVIAQWITGFSRELRSFKRLVRELRSDMRHYIILNLLYSILLDSDKSDVVIKDPSVFERRAFENRDWVIKYMETVDFPPSPINSLRTKAFEEAMGCTVNLNDRIYSLNLPTGIGKTLISLSFALKLRNNLKANGTNPRIIYALPFLSVIDQNSKVFEKVIKANGIDPDTSVLLKHHHLSEIYYRDRDIEFESDESKILIEGWNAEIIVTTFIQLFHALISNRNRCLRKFHRLADSIIILDEVQAIPVKYWLLMKQLLTEIANTLNAYIIISTATEPLIFSKEETVQVADRDFYFGSLDRIKLLPYLHKPMTIEALSETMRPETDKTYLYILNTITAAKKLYRLIKNCGLPITYLSTHIPPGERLKRIEDIKEGNYRVVVSTQLVEAGVDIDFDVVVRDVAPLDSINQSAGRCNRNGLRKGVVKVIVLKNDKGKKYADYVYDPVLLDITEKVLSGREEANEKDFLELLDEYYTLTHERTTQAESREIIESVGKMKYDRDDDDKKTLSISDFRLIADDYLKRDVFIEIDEEAEGVWQEFQRLNNIEDRFLRKQAFDSIKAAFYRYVISVPAKSENMPPLAGELGYVKRSLLDDYYDSPTGFIVKDERTMVIW